MNTTVIDGEHFRREGALAAFLRRLRENRNASLLISSLVVALCAVVPLFQGRFSFLQLFICRLVLTLSSVPLLIAVESYLFSRFKLQEFQINPQRRWRFLTSRGTAKTVLIGLTSGLLYLLDPIGAYAQRHTKAIMMVFYITDRQETSGTLSGPIFSGEPSSPPQLSYGVGTVPVVWNRWDVFRNLWSDVMLSSENTSFDLESLAPEHFYGEVSTSLQAAHNHDGLLFVHGFHNSFEDAIRTAAKLSLDLKFPGVTILYSWPSKGEFAAYDHDSDKAQVSIEHLTPVLVRLAFLPLQQATPRFHVIAHSMGTLVLSKAIEESKLNKQPLSNVILAAADIDEDIFPQVASALTSSSSRVTLYVSKWDAALELSNKLHQGTRVGRTVVCRNGMDVIDAQNADKSLLGLYHGYVFDSDLVLDDLFALAWHGDIPQERAHVHQSDDHCTWNLQPR